MIPPAGEAFAPLPTDEPVQKGMLAIRDLVRTNHSLVTHRRMPPDHAARFAKQVKVEADGILAASKIAGDAREKLRALLDEIVAGIEAVAKPEAGADRRPAGARRRGAGALWQRIRPSRLGAAAVAGLAWTLVGRLYTFIPSGIANETFPRRQVTEGAVEKEKPWTNVQSSLPSPFSSCWALFGIPPRHPR